MRRKITNSKKLIIKQTNKPRGITTLTRRVLQNPVCTGALYIMR